jgi:hypothetical protein
MSAPGNDAEAIVLDFAEPWCSGWRLYHYCKLIPKSAVMQFYCR